MSMILRYLALSGRKRTKVVIVAMANKLARIAWANYPARSP
jgi:hypothetical protein